MIRNIIFCIVIISFFTGGCSDEHGISPVSFNYNALAAPDSFKVTQGNYSLTLTWHYSSESLALTKEFLIYSDHGRGYFEYISPVDTVDAIDGNTDYTAINSMLVPNVEYCYVVSAVDSNGMEGWRTEVKCGVALIP